MSCAAAVQLAVVCVLQIRATCKTWRSEDMLKPCASDGFWRQHLCCLCLHSSENVSCAAAVQLTVPWQDTPAAQEATIIAGLRCAAFLCYSRTVQDRVTCIESQCCSMTQRPASISSR